MQSREDKAELRNRLISQGISTYPDALAAVHEFGRLVVEQCRKSLQSQLNDLQAAAAISLDERLIEPYWNPDRLSREKSDWGIWVAAKIKIEHCTLYCGLCWDKQEAYVMATLAFPSKSSRDSARQEFKRNGYTDVRDDFDEWELCFCEKIDASHAASFQDKLSGLVERWVQALKAMGGVSRLH